ncbi:cellulose synthase-like protein H1 isoform X1 [Apium graveolens]|uniref:cellulose synthase-like protein H1 isoform X1 n=1 Tax=Apium graveolens TaxID=4045 RepID=UPI003D7B4AD4
MANSLPLFDKIHQTKMVLRMVELLVLFLLLSLIIYHLVSLKSHGIPGLLAFICECSFTFNWILCVNLKWNQFQCLSYPKHLLLQFQTSELPAVDMFVTTADVELESPILTMNTVLSLLAVDYPAQKLACYLSDDGASPLTYYSLVETSKFAKIWVPFCKKYEIQVRAPFRYFTRSSEPSEEHPLEFQQEWESVKDKYEVLCQKIEIASQTFVPCEVFTEMDRKNHPTITKVIMEESVVPHLVYISREKQPKHPHHFKAGAMNVLTRVSGLMTNAPFIMNVDCDMHVNNPQVILHAMCMLLGVKNETDCAFVQFAQSFYDGLKDDPLGNQMVVMNEYVGKGLAGIQGPFYFGTNCFHRRKVIYGLSPDHSATTEDVMFMQKKFGKSLEFIKSAQILSGSIKGEKGGLWSSVEAANQAAGCDYEYGTCWGSKVGWMYGSSTEDVLTGLAIQGKGWKSMSCFTNPPSFKGCAPNNAPSFLTQMKRWSTGLLEILFTSKCPVLVTINGNLQFRQCLAYMWLLTWALMSIPELVYTLLPAYCIITNSHFLPKQDELALLIPVTLVVVYKAYTLYEYCIMRQSVRAWWNNQRMARITCTSSWLFGLIGVILKLLGLSQAVFEVTKKEQSQDYEDETNTKSGNFMFDESPLFVPGTTILLLNLTALIVGVLGFQPSVDSGNGVGIGEKICASLVVLYFWPFFKGLFGTGKYGLPVSTICKSGALALLFMIYFRSSNQT